MPTDVTMGMRIAEARGNKGYTIKETALLMGVAEKTIKKWESGKGEPRSNKMQMLAGVLGVPVAWFLEGGEQYEQDVSGVNQLEQLGQKVERIAQMQQDIIALTDEVASEVEELQAIEEDVEILLE